MGPLCRDQHLCTVVIVQAKRTFAAETMRPESTEVDVCLGQSSMGDQEPRSKHWLGQDIQNSVGNDLRVNGHLARAIRDTPNDWVKSPDDDSEACNGNEELSNLGALGLGSNTSIDG